MMARSCDGRASKCTPASRCALSADSTVETFSTGKGYGILTVTLFATTLEMKEKE